MLTQKRTLWGVRCEVWGVQGTECEGWRLQDGVHFTSSVFTNTGYGFRTPLTTAGKLMTIFLILFQVPFYLHCLASLAAKINRFLQNDWRSFFFIAKTLFAGFWIECQVTLYFWMMRRMWQLKTQIKKLKPLWWSEVVQLYQFTFLMEQCNVMSSVIWPLNQEITAQSSFSYHTAGCLVLLAMLTVIFLISTIYHACTSGFSFTNVLYFEFVRLSAVGFGDLLPEDEMTLAGAILKNIFIHIPNQIILFTLFVRVLPFLH